MAFSKNPFMGNVTTTNATATTILTLPFDAGETVMTVTVDFVGKSGNNVAFGIVRWVAKNIAGTPSVMGSPAVIASTVSDAALSTVAFSATTSGSDILIQVSGVAATTIDWIAEANIRTLQL